MLIQRAALDLLDIISQTLLSSKVNRPSYLMMVSVLLQTQYRFVLPPAVRREVNEFNLINRSVYYKRHHLVLKNNSY